MAVKIRAHETFFIRKGWLSKGIKAVCKDKDVFVSKEKNPMDVLGIGSNMVKSLRYWLQAVDITSENTKGKRSQSLTEFGKLIYENDKYVEEFGTLFLIQYKLASNEEYATSWYYFFNVFNMNEFTREDFVAGLQNYLLVKGESVAIRSLNDDFTCILGTYLPRHKISSSRVSPENNIDCPLGELGLIDIANREKHLFRKSMPNIKNINPWIVLAVIMDQASDRTEVSLNELLKAPCNIGRVFNLDAISMIDLLHNAEKTGMIKIIRTAGLDVVRLNEKQTFKECVEHYYESINRR